MSDPIGESAGAWRRWLRDPVGAAAALPDDAPLRPAIRALLIWGLAGWALGAALKVPLVFFWADWRGEPIEQALTRRAGLLAAGLFIALVWNPLHTLAWGGIFHALLSRLGAARRGARGTLVAAAWATAAATPLAFLPGVGALLHLVLFPVYQMSALRGAHGASWAKVGLAVWTPHVLGWAIAGGWWVWRAG